MLNWVDWPAFAMGVGLSLGWMVASAWAAVRRRELERENDALRAELHARIRAQYAQGWERVL